MQKQLNHLTGAWPKNLMEREFEKLSCATRSLLVAFHESCKGLELPKEFAEGLVSQSELLGYLSREVASWSHNPLPIGDMDGICFNRLRDAYSLYPINPFFWKFLSIYCCLVSAESSNKLASYVLSKPVMLHISCKARIERAFASIKSFQGCRDDICHIVVVGSEEQASGGLRFSFDSNVLEIPIADGYESHCAKCLHAFTLISLLCKPSLLVKVDDDVRLADSALFNSHLTSLLSANTQYAGVVNQGIPSHEKTWHGWHIGKCADKKLERRGYQVPIPRSYIDGGFSYAVGIESLIYVAKFYLHHRKFLAARSIMFEDTMVGLAMELAGVSPTSIPPLSMGLISERHLMQESLGHNMTVFSQRMTPVVAALTKDYLI